LLDRTVQMLAAVGGAVWLVDPDAGLQLQCEINLQSLAPLTDSQQEDNSHGRLLEQVFREGRPALIPSRSARSGPEARRNPTDFVLIIHPLTVDQEVVGLIEIIQRPTTNAATRRGTQRLVSIVCECASDRLKRDRIRTLDQSQARSRQFEYFAHRIHESLDLRRTAYELVNEGRNYLDCDRVSVAVRNWRKYRLLAISGVDTLNQRSNVVRHLEQLASGEIPYVGVLGPRARRDRLREMANCSNFEVYGPVGLDIGAELPASIALSIAAEIHAVLNDRDGLPLTLRAND